MVTLLALVLATQAPFTSRSTIAPGDLVEVAVIRDIAVSPDGRRIAYRVIRSSIKENIERSVWRVVPIDGRGRSVRIADGGEAILTYVGEHGAQPATWSPDGRSLFFRALVGGTVQVWRAGLGKRPRTVTHDASDVRDFMLAPGGDSLVYRVGATRAAIRAEERTIYDEGLRADATTDLAQPVIGSVVAGGRRRMLRFTGDWFSRAPLLDDRPTRDLQISLATGRTVPVAGRSLLGPPRASVALPIRNARGDRVRLDRTDGVRRPVVDRLDGTTVRCDATICRGERIRDLLWGDDDNRIILVAETDNRRSEILEWQLATDATRTIVTTPDDLSQCARAAAALVCVASAALAPPRLVRIDLGSGTQTTLDDPNGGLRDRIAAHTRLLDWTAAGTNFRGILVEAPGRARPAPLVISYYVCSGFLRGAAGEDLPVLALVAAGMSVLCVDAAKRDGPLDRNADYALARAGLLAVIARLAHEGAVDRARIGMHGFSFGSEVALNMALQSDALRAISLDSAQLEPGYFWMYALPGRNVEAMLQRFWHIGSPEADPAGWQRVAPLNRMAHLDVPVLMQLPESEARLVTEFFGRALRAGKPVELFAFADETHLKSQPRHRLAAMNRNLDWFGYWLRDSRNPAKPNQSERWDVLRGRLAAARRDGARP